MYRSIQRGHRGSEPGRSGGHDPPRGGLHPLRNRRTRRHHPLLHHRKIVSLTKYENVFCIPPPGSANADGTKPKGKWGGGIPCESCTGHKRCSLMAIKSCFFASSSLIL